MAPYGVRLVSALLLVTSCVGQDRGFIDSRLAPWAISTVLSAAHVSGSLEFEGRRGPHTWQPDIPRVRDLSDYSGSPREVLQKMFADDPKMRVTQESGKTIRMVETDVPSDLLDVKIRHITFRSQSTGEPIVGCGANSALIRILSTPEVLAFMEANNIGPRGDELPAPGSSGSGRRAYGELDNVTVSQALDYVLQIFPGFWIYRTCPSVEGKRKVFLNFF